MRLRVEFTTEPFDTEGDSRPAHVEAAAAALRRAGVDPDLGPFGTFAEGEDRTVLPALAAALQDAFAHGATRVTLQVEREA